MIDGPCPTGITPQSTANCSPFLSQSIHISHTLSALTFATVARGAEGLPRVVSERLLGKKRKDSKQDWDQLGVDSFEACVEVGLAPIDYYSLNSKKIQSQVFDYCTAAAIVLISFTFLGVSLQVIAQGLQYIETKTTQSWIRSLEFGGVIGFLVRKSARFKVPSVFNQGSIPL